MYIFTATNFFYFIFYFILIIYLFCNAPLGDSPAVCSSLNYKLISDQSIDLVTEEKWQGRGKADYFFISVADMTDEDSC